MTILRLMEEGGGTLTPEEIQQIVAQNKALEAQNKLLQDGNKALQGRFGELSQQVAALANSRQPGAAQVPDDTPELDPGARKALEKLIDAKMAPAVQVVMSNEETRQIAELASMEFYENYKDEISAVMAQAAPQARARAGFARAAYDYVIGKHFEEAAALKAEKIKKKAEFTETAPAAAPAGRQAGKVTPEEKHVIEASGQTVEEYIAWRDDPEAQIAKLTKARSAS